MHTYIYNIKINLILMEENTTALVIKKSSMWKYASFIILIVAVIGIFMFVKAGGANNNPATGNVVNDNSGDVQRITLGVKNYNYYPNEITVKAGKPVSITLDSSVQGCLRSFNIKDLGVRGYSKSPSQTIDFTPTQKGMFAFACSMGMGYGKIIVE